MAKKFNPDIHMSVVRNYRHMFVEAHGHDCRLKDEAIWEIFETVFVDTSSREQDEERVAEMKRMEDEL